MNFPTLRDFNANNFNSRSRVEMNEAGMKSYNLISQTFLALKLFDYFQGKLNKGRDFLFVTFPVENIRPETFHKQNSVTKKGKLCKNKKLSEKLSRLVKKQNMN